MGQRLGASCPEVAGAIVAARVETRQDRWPDQFVVDAVQGGAGMSTNTNTNALIPNRALQILVRSPGDHDVMHALDHVNRAPTMPAPSPPRAS